MATLGAYTFPRREAELICILTPERPAVFTPSSNLSSTGNESGSVIEQYERFFSLMPDRDISIRDISADGLTMEFDMTGVDCCIANSLRRSMLSEVPSMAPETVLMMQNTSVFPDDTIGSRIGLVPFKADPRKFKFRPKDSKSEHPIHTMMFELIVLPTKPEKGAKTPTPNVNVYSGNFRWVKHPDKNLRAPDVPESDFRPVFEDILLATMLPQQDIQLRVHVVKGIGRDHVKFSPVSTAFFRPTPSVRLLRPVIGAQALRLQSYFPKGLIDVIEKDGQTEAVVKDCTLFKTQRKVFEDAELRDAVRIGFKETEFMFSIESVGALKASVIVKEAFKILKLRCEYHHIFLDLYNTHRWGSAIKVEDDS